MSSLCILELTKADTNSMNKYLWYPNDVASSFPYGFCSIVMYFTWTTGFPLPRAN